MSKEIPFVLAMLVLLLAIPVAAYSQTETQIKEIAEMAAKFHIRIETRDEHFPVQTIWGKIEGKDPKPSALVGYLPIFISEFSLYPPEAIVRSELQSIIICEDLYFVGERRGAIPDYSHDTLYLDAERGMYDTLYMRRVLHHEFFHIIDWKDDGQVYEDNEWKQLNPVGFNYGSGGRSAQSDSSMGVVNKSLGGFLSKYSQTGVEEDKAEMFANMMIDYAMVDSLAKQDPIIKAKMKRIKELLFNFSPAFNDTFWSKISDRKIGNSNL